MYVYIYILTQKEREREIRWMNYCSLSIWDLLHMIDLHIYMMYIYIYVYIYICILNCTYIYSCKYPWHPNDRKADAQGVRQDLVPEDLVLTQQQQR